MTWTYTNNPAGSSRDALRLAVGDTIENDPRLSDEEVEHFLGLYPDSLDLAAAQGDGDVEGVVMPRRPQTARDTLPGGWLVATNLNNVLKKTIIRLAAEVAGLKFGKDVVVEF